MNHFLDKIDESIIRLLQEDGRMPSAEIARRIGSGVTERIVRFRIQKLVVNGIMHVHAYFNPEKLGLRVCADVWISTGGINVMEIARKLAGFEQVSYVALSTGEWDISIQVYARNNFELHRFVTETIVNVPGVKKASFVILPVVLKDLFEWRLPSDIEPD